MDQSARPSGTVERLLASCEALRPRWEVQRDSSGEGLNYIEINWLAVAVAESYASEGADHLAPLFAEVEAILANSTTDERNLVVVGFLEDLQNALGWRRLDAGPIYGMLGAQARTEWDGLVVSWAEVRQKLRSGELPERSRPAPDLAKISDPRVRELIQHIERAPDMGDEGPPPETERRKPRG